MEVNSSTILDPLGASQFLPCPQAMPFFQGLCHVCSPPVSVPPGMDTGLGWRRGPKASPLQILTPGPGMVRRSLLTSDSYSSSKDTAWESAFCRETEPQDVCVHRRILRTRNWLTPSGRLGSSGSWSRRVGPGGQKVSVLVQKPVGSSLEEGPHFSLSLKAACVRAPDLAGGVPSHSAFCSLWAFT